MENILYKKRWSPYLVGAGIGLLNVGTIYFLQQTIGASSAFERVGALLYSVFTPQHFDATGYHFASKPFINWSCAFVGGIFIGSYISARMSNYTVQRIPSVWQENFGASEVKRAIFAFVGGVIIMLGARIARGCTSGHAISGGMHLATAGWLFMITLFCSGIITAQVLYTKGK